ncbi:MAG: S8 family serine peptidase [Rhodobacter sp.]|nr:S8 family serine peptidase [Rhodobacter sp.]
MANGKDDKDARPGGRKRAGTRASGDATPASRPGGRSGGSARGRTAGTASAAPASPLLRGFLDEIQDAQTTVVVDLGTSLEVASAGGPSRLALLQDIAGAEAMPVFERRRAARGATVASLSGAPQAPAAPGFDTGRFVEFAAGSASDAADLAAELRKSAGEIEAIPAPPAVPALGPASADAGPGAAGIEVPNFFNYQGYLADGPSGLGFIGAWALPGGDGSGVTIIDVEGGWRSSHLELTESRFSLWEGRNSETESWMEHGTAVVSVLASTHDGHGTASVCPGARTGMVSVFDSKDGRQRIANNISAAGELLNPGDVLLLELQRPGPRTSYAADPDQRGYVPLTFWPDVRAVVQYLVGRGITVVAVGGNGGENLDDEIYGDRFDLEKNDAGCIMVGAGAPPNGLFGPARSKMDFSNYGSVMDVQAWGQSVVSGGYGDLWGGDSAVDQRYTSQFMGTSSAAPLIAGLVACVQGRHMAVYGVPVNPLYLRQVLRTLGWAPEGDEDPGGAPSFVLQPDLRQIFAALDIG